MFKNIKKYQENISPKDQAASLREIMRQRGRYQPSQKENIQENDFSKEDQASALRDIMRSKQQNKVEVEQLLAVDKLVFDPDESSSKSLQMLLGEMYREAGLDAPKFDSKITYITGIFLSSDKELFLVLVGPDIYRNLKGEIKQKLLPLMVEQTRASLMITFDEKVTICEKCYDPEYQWGS